MSDGHFDRTFLPKNSFQSALNVGKAMERKHCEEILQETLQEILHDQPTVAEKIKDTFQQKLQAQK